MTFRFPIVGCVRDLLNPPVAAILLALLLAAAAAAQQASPDLAEMSLEDLLNIEVTSVARREQKLSQSASAIYVITQEDIRRSGVTSVPDALRMAPGVQVGQMDGNKWAVSIRGFNGRFANKLLVMIDGRSVYNPAFAGVYWDANDVLLEDVDRIEVIRGPGATLWGSNAVNGVINIITKNTTDTLGALVSTGGGDQEGGFGEARFGGEVDPRLRYRFYSKYFSRSGSFLPSGERLADNWLKLQGGFRVDWEPSDRDAVMITGDAYEGDGGDRQNLPLYEPPYQAIATYRASFTGANLLGRWTRRHSERSSTQIQAFYDHSTRDDLYIRDTVVGVADVELQHQRDFSRHRLVAGVGFRVNNHDQPTDWVARYEPRDRTTNRVSTFVQDEIALSPDKLLLTLGTKLERSTFSGVELEPSVSLLWNHSPKDTVWLTFARATRSPSRVDHDVVFTYFVAPGPEDTQIVGEAEGNPEIHSEHMLTYGGGYRISPRPRWSFDLTGFYSVYHSVVTTLQQSPEMRPGFPQTLFVPFTFENALNPTLYGAEAAAAWKPLESADLRMSYSYLTGGIASASDVPGPRHQLHARWFWRPRAKWDWDNNYYFVDGFSGVPAYHRVDSRLGWRPLRQWEFSVTVQNLLDNRHPETPPILSLADQIGRSIYGRLTWRLASH